MPIRPRRPTIAGGGVGVIQSYYQSSISDFLKNEEKNIIGLLKTDYQDLQEWAWEQQIRHLKKYLTGFSGEIFFELKIPRMGKRADVVLLINGIVFVVEYKNNANKYERADIIQSVDYALDLKNFHKGSHDAVIVPILIATHARDFENTYTIGDDKVAECLCTNAKNFKSVLRCAIQEWGNYSLDYTVWKKGGYAPTPTIIEAAKFLYNNHNVKDISRTDDNAKNLQQTSDCINKIIDKSKKCNKKSIIFVTGVPGAGKTLAGLNIASARQKYEQQEHATFLSGNGPLVEVLRESLALEYAQKKGETKSNSRRKVHTFIQNIHHFRDDNLESEGATVEKVVIFDEAQRAWDKDRASNFMQRNKGKTGFDQSEPEFLIEVMDRQKDWAVIICLIGGGQEINKGEAGLSEWFRALQNRFKHWNVYVSDMLYQSEYQLGGNVNEIVKNVEWHRKPDLHLAMNIRSFRAEKLSEFVASVLEKRPIDAKRIYETLSDKYPLYITRDLNVAKSFLKKKKRGSESYGLTAYSNAVRLKPCGIYVKNEIKATNYFLGADNDVRSCYFLEDVATEFAIQGLELDWVGFCWDINLCPIDTGWKYKKFKGSKWQNVKKESDQKYLLNAYRVLMTRARQGMIIYVPMGDKTDQGHTRPPEKYQEVYEYLLDCGIKVYQ